MSIKKVLILTLVLLIFNSLVFSVYAIEPTETINVSMKKTCWAHGLNNNVRVIDFDDGKKYFKESKRKLSIRSEVERIINDYFLEFCVDNNCKVNKELISKSLYNESNLKKFVNMGFLWNSKSNLSKFLKGKVSSSDLGIDNIYNKGATIDLKDFFLYSSRELINRQISTNIEEGELQTNLAGRQLATYRLAKYFSVDSVVVKTRFVRLLTSFGEKFGVLTDIAEGVDISKLKGIDLEITPRFQLELTELQILDSISWEQDHNTGNCFIKVNDGNKLVGVTAFDNEGCFGLVTDLTKGLCWGKISPILTKENKINLPHMSKPLAEKILSTENEDVDRILGDLLSENQLFAVKCRLEIIKNAIYNTIKDNDGFLLDDNQWSSDTVREECSGCFGNTYLNHFYNVLVSTKN